MAANVNSQTQHRAIVADRFNKSTCKALLKAGYVLIGVQQVPDDGPAGWANPRTCYILEFEGQGIVRTLDEVLAFAGK